MAQHSVVTGADRTETPATASVRLIVPAHRDYVVIVRSAVAYLGACFGFTIGEIGDVRLAVDEACNLLVEAGSAARGRAGAAGAARAAQDVADVPDLECHAEVRGGLLRVTVAGAAATAEPPDTEGFGWTILAALVDSLTWDHDGGTVRIELEKRHGARSR